MLAGNAKVTFKNRETGNRYTFQIKKNKKSQTQMHWVRVLTGSDNYSYLGTLYEGQTLRLTKASTITKEATSYKVFVFVLRHLRAGTLPEQIEIWHEGKCGRCGTTLTVPESIEAGFGPVCAKLEGVELKKSTTPQKVEVKKPVEKKITVVACRVQYYPTHNVPVEFVVGDEGELIGELSDCGMTAKFLHENGLPGSLHLDIDGGTSIVGYKRQEMTPDGEEVAAYHYAGPKHKVILFND